MVFRLQYDNLARSLAVLQDYQADCQDALDWQLANNIQPGDLLPLRDAFLPLLDGDSLPMDSEDF